MNFRVHTIFMRTMSGMTGEWTRTEDYPADSLHIFTRLCFSRSWSCVYLVCHLFFGVATQTRYVDCLNNTKKTFHASIMTRTCLVLYTESASMKRRETKIDSNSDKETVRVSSWTAFDDTYVRYVCDSARARARAHTHTHTHLIWGTPVSIPRVLKTWIVNHTLFEPVLRVCASIVFMSLRFGR